MVVPVVVASKMVACGGREELLKWLTCAAVPAAPRCWRWRRKVEADGELLVWGRELATAGDGEGEDRTGGCAGGGERDAGLAERERELLQLLYTYIVSELSPVFVGCSKHGHTILTYVHPYVCMYAHMVVCILRHAQLSSGF